ncbi:hypothetical protein GH810_13990 [Acetobacterium paludosum]|uniref:Uncharacterized protein n=1 Tax=Acetobacterium paludosum TaxID=52693 RepID=A0A923HYD9_9FIRM|nr:hypothetical protein [Acetobacterium paludosum]MBC3889422.1 hypothetical protein [Acetobacterium paludosum]
MRSYTYTKVNSVADLSIEGKYYYGFDSTTSSNCLIISLSSADSLLFYGSDEKITALEGWNIIGTNAPASQIGPIPVTYQ